MTDLWVEWEQVLFANVQDEVAQDNLNECVHVLLDKAATLGAGTCEVETTEDLEAENDRLEDENAKLRDLVRDIWRHMVHAAWHEESPCPADFADRMRELGIEVA